jgi:hypothetical protein
MIVKHTSASDACAAGSLSDSILYTVQTMRSAPVDTPTTNPSSAGGTCDQTSQQRTCVSIPEVIVSN